MADQTVLTMNNSDNNSLDNCANDFFTELYKIQPAVIIGLVLAFLSICIIIPIFYSIIWYEKFGSDKKRTVLNKLVGSVCWCIIFAYVFIQIPELIRYCFGPLPTFVCYLNLVIKNTLSIQLMLTFDAISILRYIFIFWLKNPYSFCDDFWTIFLNLWMFSLALISQIAFAILPGM
jgi:hypothetical protein